MNEICETELIKKEILFIDGLTRVGKSMLNTIVGSLDNISHPQFFEPLEQLLPMFKSKHVDRNAISSFIRLQLNERFYNYCLSRNVNFRYDDLTSIYNSNKSLEFLKNLSKEDGEIVIEKLLQNTEIHQFQTHDILTHYSLFLQLNIHVQIIELFRNPIDTVYSWYKRGWGSRFDKEDPRSFTSLYKFEGKTLPHYAIGHEKKYFSLNEMEKCVFLHNLLLRMSLDEYTKLPKGQRVNILLVKFEDVLENSSKELDRICSFLNTSKTNFTAASLKNENLPREVALDARIKKLKEIKQKVNKDLYNDLIVLKNEYNTNFYNLEK